MMAWLQANLPSVGVFVHQLGERVGFVLSNPRQNPLQAMMLAAGVAVFIMLLVVLGMLAIDLIRTAGRRQRLGVKRSRRKFNWHRNLVVLVALSVLAVLVAVAPVIPAAGSACGSCHDVAPAVSSWRADVHRNTSCYSCHADAGLLGTLQASVSGATQLVGQRQVVGQVRSAGCIDCHDSEMTGTVRVRGIIVQHREMLAAGMSCVTCHPNVGHTAATKATDEAGGGLKAAYAEIGYRNRMAACLACHDGKSASAACETCHESRASDIESEPQASADFVTTDTCRGCHKASTTALCTDCHGLEMPHTGQFMQSHANEAVRSVATCARCHEGVSAGQSCSCHAFGETHGDLSVWILQHGPAANVGWPGGCLCHDASRCLICHQGNPVSGGPALGQ